VVRLVAGTGEFGNSCDGGPARRARIGSGALAALPDGSILLADDSTRIRKVDANGTITTPPKLFGRVDQVTVLPSS
jgi:hypothetical protein